MADHGATLRLQTIEPDRLAHRVTTARRAVADILGDGVSFSEIRHVGSTAVVGLLGKGDLDLQVRLTREQWRDAVDAFGNAVTPNPGAYNDDNGRSFDLVVDGESVPVGVHLTVKDGPHDEQWVYARLLADDADAVSALNAIKRRYDGADMDAYREAKGAFYDGLRTDWRFAMYRGLDGHPVVFRGEVQWGEMDALQHVNNVAYFRWLESARMAYFEAIAFVPSSTGVGPILASTGCRYKRPMLWPDRYAIGVRAHDVGADRFKMSLAIWSEQLACIAAVGEAVIVAYDYGTLQKAPLPSAVLQRLAL